MKITKKDIGQWFRTRNGLYAVMTSYDTSGGTYPCDFMVFYSGLTGWKQETYTGLGHFLSDVFNGHLDIVSSVDTEVALAELALIGAEPVRRGRR